MIRKFTIQRFAFWDTHSWRKRHHFTYSIPRVMSSTADGAGTTIFDKIISREIPATIIHEDEDCLAFEDINPQAPVHFLVIPKKRDGLTRLSKAQEKHKAILGHLMFIAQSVAKEKGLEEGFRVVVNDGPMGGQEVWHLHVHVLGGRQLTWPPG